MNCKGKRGYESTYLFDLQLIIVNKVLAKALELNEVNKKKYRIEINKKVW